MKSMVAEITDSTNVAEAYGILPIPWSIGTTLGYVFVIYCVYILSY